MLHPRPCRVYLSIYLSSIAIVCLIKSKLYVDRRRSPGLDVFSGERGSKRITTYPVKGTSYASMDVWGNHFAFKLAKHFGSDETVEFLCKLAMPRLSSGV